MIRKIASFRVSRVNEQKRCKQKGALKREAEECLQDFLLRIQSDTSRQNKLDFNTKLLSNKLRSSTNGSEREVVMREGD